MRAHTGGFPDEWRPDPVNLYALFAVIVQLICEVVGGANQVVFAWNKNAALFLYVGGKTSGISGSKNRIHCVIFQTLRSLWVTCHLTGKAAQFTPHLTGGDAKELELADPVKARPADGAFHAICHRLS
ncbi:Uncharacterised protein [Escherichia coli]|nr:Uncharacterised protein [Escherichia coli]SQP43062.1 Uncharacterised protein [Escherichia coli]